MNLLLDSHVPVMRRSGLRERLAPWQITDRLGEDPILDVDAPRASLRSAYFHLLVGLLQTFRMPSDGKAWVEAFMAPPAPAELKRAFAPHAVHFECRSIGSSFMEERGVAPDGKGPLPVALLAMEGPGDNTLDINQDFFNKRGAVRGLCRACAAMVLFELQVNANSGGRGHRTSVRGGGPLSTFVIPRAGQEREATLWEKLWANVLDAQEWPEGVWTQVEAVFPWIRGPRVGEEAPQVLPSNAPGLTTLWGMPRRIELVEGETIDVTCDQCGTVCGAVVEAFYALPNGENYGLWEHPYSPHRNAVVDKATKAEGLLPIHASRSEVGFETWPRMVFPVDQGAPARVVTAMMAHGSRKSVLARQTGWSIWAHGFETDNAKVLGFWSSELPLIVPPDGVSPQRITDQAQRMVEGAKMAQKVLRWAIKMAWFRAPDRRKDPEFIDQALMTAAEDSFFANLKVFSNGLLPDAEANDEELRDQVGGCWRSTLRQIAEQIFATWVDRGQAEVDPRRASAGRLYLQGQLSSDKFRGLLGMRIPEKAKPSKTKKIAQKGTA